MAGHQERLRSSDPTCPLEIVPELLSTEMIVDNHFNTAFSRTLMLAALFIHTQSLALPRRDFEKEGSFDSLESWSVNGVQGVNKELTGSKETPYAIFVIINLPMLFGTDLYKESTWKRLVPWGSFILLVYFAFEGAPLRTSAGLTAVVCHGVVPKATSRNGTERQRACEITVGQKIACLFCQVMELEK